MVGFDDAPQVRAAKPATTMPPPPPKPDGVRKELKMLDLIKRFVKEEEGATMVEYGLMVALIAVVCILVVTALGTALGTKFDEVQNAVDDAGSAPVTPT